MHPIHVEAVAWASSVLDLSDASFYLLALYLLIRGGDRPRFIAASLVAYTASLLSKEPAITLPVLALTYWTMTDGRVVGLRGIAWQTVHWIIVTVAYVVVRSLVLGGVAPQVVTVDLAPREYALSALALLGRFLRAEVPPLELNFWHVFAPVRSILTVQSALALVTVGAWCGLLGPSRNGLPLRLLG